MQVKEAIYNRRAIKQFDADHRMAAYQNTPIAAFDLCSVGTVTDFKEVARYRLLGTGGFEQVAADGELKHGKLSDQKYSNKADTYGQILTLTRHDIINDDLSAFMDIPRQMGRSGAESIDDLFFTLLLKNAGFFSSANANLLQGADNHTFPTLVQLDDIPWMIAEIDGSESPERRRRWSTYRTFPAGVPSISTARRCSSGSAPAKPPASRSFTPKSASNTETKPWRSDVRLAVGNGRSMRLVI